MTETHGDRMSENLNSDRDWHRITRIKIKKNPHNLQGFETSTDHPRFPWVHQHDRSSVRSVQDCGGRKNTQLHPPAGEVID